jgi:hypothetical protein
MTIFDGRPDRAFLWNLVPLYNSACQALDRLEANACSSISWSIGYSSYEQLMLDGSKPCSSE